MDKKLSRDIEKELDEISFQSYAVYIEGKLLASSLKMGKETPVGGNEKG